MRRLALILCLCLLASLTLTACGKKDVLTAEQVLPAARTLIERAETVNTAMLGSGVPVGSEGFGEFLFADEAWEDENNIHSVEDLLALTATVYTAYWYDVLYQEVITKDGMEAPDYQNRAKTTNNPDGGLLVYRDRKGRDPVPTTREYLFDTMKMTAASATAATVTLTVRVIPEGYPPQDRELSLSLVFSDGGFFADKLTYVAYDYSLIDD